MGPLAHARSTAQRGARWRRGHQRAVRGGAAQVDGEGQAATGVSLAWTVPPIASMNPRATVSPRPIPLVAFGSPSRWNGIVKLSDQTRV